MILMSRIGRMYLMYDPNTDRYVILKDNDNLVFESNQKSIAMTFWRKVKQGV